MRKCRKYFHLLLILAAIVIGSLSLWHSGFWMVGKNILPNFTAIAMVLLVFSQEMLLKARLKEGEILVLKKRGVDLNL